jgi:transposase
VAKSVYERLRSTRYLAQAQASASPSKVEVPYVSGGMNHEQGIAKAGNARIRSLIVEMAWIWLQRQPDSALSRWFQARFASGGARMRRIGIVALARRLLIALWRYVEQGVIPEGAKLKATGA